MEDGYADMLIEVEDSPYVQDSSPTTTWSYDMLNPMIYVNYFLQFLEAYGWVLLGAALASAWLAHALRPHYRRLRQQWDDAEHHKDPDKALARMEAIQRAREAQQQRLEEASQRARELQQEREEKKRAEALERLQKYGAAGAGGTGGRRLGGEDDYLPLGGGGAGSSYRPPKRSKCGGGGCGR